MKKAVCVGVCFPSSENYARDVVNIHNEHHLGVERTAHIAERRLGCKVDKGVVEDVVKSCHICRSIDPHPVKWDHGKVSVPDVWQRLAADITHVSSVPYLSLIDCGPSRFALWFKLPNETADAVTAQLEKVFRERGPPLEFMSDNGPCFKSVRTKQLLAKWDIDQVFSCAYRPSGNGVIERHHRTIKRMVARTGRKVEDMVYWYNNSPNSDGVVPADSLYSYKPRLPNMKCRDEPKELLAKNVSASNTLAAGDMVYVKPPGARCMDRWKLGKIDRVVSDTAVQVDGTNRHIADVRFAWHNSDSPRKQDSVEIESLPENSIDIADPAGQQDANFNFDNEIVHDVNDASNIDNSDDSEHESEHCDEGSEVRDRRPPKWLADFYTF